MIDDDLAVLESCQFMLELGGFSVSTFASASAYLRANGDRPRCLILDQHMPHMSGLELAARLRSESRQMPILLVTAAPSPALIAQSAESGVERVLHKPPAEEDLIAFVNAHQ